MGAKFEQAIVKTLMYEGGSKFTDDPVDKGGITKYGISQRAYPDVDIYNLTEHQARVLYKRDYWDCIRADEILSQRIAETMFDAAVNMGVRIASQIAQKSAEILPADGIIGSQSLRAINKIDIELFIAKFAIRKIERYANIVHKDPSQKKYLFGWINRTLHNIV